MALSITERNIGDVTVLTCSGRIVEGDETQALEAKFVEAFGETSYIVLDLSQVDFLDSSGLGLLVRLLNRTRAAAGDLKLCAVSRKVDTVLRATRLAGVFDLVANVEAALAAFTRPAALPGGDVRSPEILCVDRSADVLAYLKELLRQAGYEAITSSNIPDALTLLRATRPKVVVVGAAVRSHPATRANAAFGALSSARAVIDLPENFSIDDAGDVAHRLIEQVRSKMATAAS
jgi:anti-sigma B factor antagonist